MTEETEKQKELFEEFEKPEKKLSFFRNNKRFLQNRIFVFQFSREKLALLLLGLVVLISVAFCLGVERGKNLRPQAQIPPQPQLQAQTQPKLDRRDIPVPPHQAPMLGGVRKPRLSELSDSPKAYIYTIRIATYINKGPAERALTKIKQSGLPAYIKASGRFFMICVGDYNDKKQAESALSRLKKTYKDSYIKTTKK